MMRILKNRKVYLQFRDIYHLRECWDKNICYVDYPLSRRYSFERYGKGNKPVYVSFYKNYTNPCHFMAGGENRVVKNVVTTDGAFKYYNYKKIVMK